jgi:hypothetical protein
MAEGETLVNAVLGALATIVLSPFVPFAPVAGGAVSGYLQGGRRDDGLRVGAVSGAIALIPVVLVVFFVGGIFLTMFTGGFGMPGAMGGLGAVILIFGLLFAVVYTVGLSALGGWLGNYVKYDTDIGD